MKTTPPRSTDDNMRRGELIASLPVVERNSNIQLSEQDRTYDPGRQMSPERRRKVGQVLHSLVTRLPET